MSGMGGGAGSIREITDFLKLVQDPKAYEDKMDGLVAAHQSADEARIAVVEAQKKLQAAQDKHDDDVADLAAREAEFARTKNSILATEKTFVDREAAVLEREKAAKTYDDSFRKAKAEWDATVDAKTKDLDAREKAVSVKENKLDTFERELISKQADIDSKVSRLKSIIG